MERILFFLIMLVCSSNLDASDCSLEQGHSADRLIQLKSEGELAEATLRQIEGFQRFMNARKWEENKPMDQQMTATEAGEFGKYQKQQEIALMKQLFESRRERDIRVLRKLAILADKISRYGLEESVGTDKESEELLLAGVLLASRDLVSVDVRELKLDGSRVCNLKTALENLAGDAVEELGNVGDLTAATTEIQRLAKKYGTPFDLKKFLEVERKNFLTSVRPQLEKSQALLQRAEDMYRLSMIESTSKKMLAAHRQDQYESPGDQQYSGTTWERWRKEGRVTERDHQLTGVLNFINLKIPAPIISDWEEISRKK